MKSKKSIYVLLPIVVLIWGALIYKFFSFNGDNESIQLSNDFSAKPFALGKVDTFSINVNYRDPFLGKIYRPNTVKVKKRASNPAKPEVIVWPQIQYKGIVSDNQGKTKIFMLIINGQTFLMRKGAVENEVLLKDGDRNTVDLIYRGEKNTIEIQE